MPHIGFNSICSKLIYFSSIVKQVFTIYLNHSQVCFLEPTSTSVIWGIMVVTRVRSNYISLVNTSISWKYCVWCSLGEIYFDLTLKQTNILYMCRIIVYFVFHCILICCIYNLSLIKFCSVLYVSCCVKVWNADKNSFPANT